MTATQIIDHYDAVDIAACLAPCHGVRAFDKTGEITVGFRASVELHAVSSSYFDQLNEYVKARVATGDTNKPSDWPF